VAIVNPNDELRALESETKECHTCGKEVAIILIRNLTNGSVFRQSVGPKGLMHGSILIRRERVTRWNAETRQRLTKLDELGPAVADQVVCSECIAKLVPEEEAIWVWLLAAGLERVEPHVEVVTRRVSSHRTNISGESFEMGNTETAYNHVAACMQNKKYGAGLGKKDRYGYGVGGPVHARLMRWLKWRDKLLGAKL
jgi:hypothetical protein